MIIGIELPKGAKVEIQDGRAFIIFDESQFRYHEFYAARLGIWVTEGQTEADFYDNPALNKKASLVVPKSKRSLKIE